MSGGGSAVGHIPPGMKVTPQVICGPVHSANKSALDWSWLGPVAFGCCKYVVVVDPRTSQNLQTLDGHSSNITKVRWSRQLHHSTLATPYILRLASVDTNGQCIVWDVGQATHISNFTIGNRPLVDIQWLTTNDSCRDLLLIFCSPGTMTIWNADTGTRISRFTFAETISAFCFNPFSPDQLVLLSTECFIFINEFNPQKNPTGNSKKMYMNIPHQQSIGGGGRGWSREAPRRLLSDESLSSDDSLSLTDCLQVAFSPLCRSHLFLLYSREILIIDTEIMQAVGSIYLERVSAPFLQMFPCQQRDALYCLHENGSVSFRVRQPVEFPQTSTLTMADFRELIDVTYDLYYLTEPQRISKNIRPLTFTVCPSTELQFTILTSEGKLLFWDMGFECVGVYDGGKGEGGSGAPLSLVSALPVGIGEERGMGSQCEGLTLSGSIAPHWFNPSDGPNIYSLVSPVMMLAHIYCGLSSTPTVIKMCPPLTTKNWSFYKPLVAVGNGTGGVQIVNLSTRQLYREITVHTCSVRGIEWLSHNSLLTYAYPPPNNNGLVRNELAAVNLDTGHVTQLKKGETTYVQPITSIRISTHKNYFVVNIKDTPPEFYNAKSLTFMRSLESKPSSFVAVEWANASAFSSFVPKPHPPRVLSPSNKTENEIESLSPNPHRETKSSQLPEKEILSLIDNNCNIHHITIDRAGFQLGPQSSQNFALRLPTAMSWKGDTLIAGDSEGTLMLWDLPASTLKYIETPKSLIKKMKFGPGKGNRRLFILYSNRVEIRDIKEDDILGQFKWSKGELSVDDIDWCSSDKLVCLMSDGTLRVTDVKFIYSSTAYGPTDYHETVFNPPTMLPQSIFRFKCLLQHQSWNIDYSLDHSDLADSAVDPIEKGVAVLMETLPNQFREALMEAKLSTPQRSLITSVLLGDEHEMQFWTTALYHMIKEKSRLQDPQYRKYHYSSATPNQYSEDIIQPDSSASTDIISSLRNSLEDLLEDEGRTSETLIQEANQRAWQLTPPLDLSYDLFMDQDIYKHYQLHRVLCHDGRRHTTSQTRHCAETLLFLRQTDRAVQLLLETDTSSNDYYTDALKACLAATIRSSGASQSTIKLVATNLIANNKLSEGAQLLALIDKGLDACRYLQTYGNWYKSVWLAKSTLNEREAKEVLMRWAENLASSSVNQKKKALLVYLSLGQFIKVTEMLYSMRYFNLAAVFAESCLEYKLMRRNKETSSLIEAVFLEYARYVDSLGMKRAMRYYCNLAGENGKLLLEEHLSPSQGKAPNVTSSP